MRITTTLSADEVAAVLTEHLNKKFTKDQMVKLTMVTVEYDTTVTGVEVPNQKMHVSFDLVKLPESRL